MEDFEKTVSVNVENYRGEKPIEVIIRKGEAAKAADPLPTKEPIKTKIEGVISTPKDWLEKRVGTIDQKRANIIVDREGMTITLTVNENDEYLKGTVTGKVEFTEIFKKTKINNPTEGWAPDRLGQFLRLNRGIANVDRNEWAKLVSGLKSFKATVQSNIEKVRDSSGSRSDIFQMVVQSELPKSFQVNIPIFRGQPKSVIEVEFDHYVVDGECVLQLVSPGANDEVEAYRDKCIDEVLGKIREIAPEIAIMEK